MMSMAGQSGITSGKNGSHAIVIGGSIAGLCAARVLSDHFARVTILERDPVHDEPESRKGQPQTRHVHGILAPMHRFLSTYLPGVEQAMLDGGAGTGDIAQYVRWFAFGGYRIQGPVGVNGIVMSRPFLEWHVRRAVTARPNVTLLAETPAEELITDGNRSRITGVKVTHRAEGNASDVLNADLVVDVSGRGSQSPRWLSQLGFEPPEDEEVKINFSYATRIYHRKDEGKIPFLYMTQPTPPERDGAFMFPVEGMRWIVTAGRFAKETPPSDDAGFLEYLRNLPTQDIFRIVSKTEPLSDVVTYSYPSSRRRRYDKLTRFPDGYFVLGDAVASFNPLYGQGMSSAAMQIEVLDATLKQADWNGAWRSFFSRTRKIVDLPWQLAVGEDFRYPETSGKRPPAIDLINGYVAQVHRATHRDPVVYRQFLRVTNLLASPSSLLQPHIVWRVLRANVVKN